MRKVNRKRDRRGYAVNVTICNYNIIGITGQQEACKQTVEPGAGAIIERSNLL